MRKELFQLVQKLRDSGYDLVADAVEKITEYGSNEEVRIFCDLIGESSTKF